MLGLVLPTAGTKIGKNVTRNHDGQECTIRGAHTFITGDIKAFVGKMDVVIAMDHNGVLERQSSHAQGTAGTTIGESEINEQELPDSPTKDVLTDITGVDGVIALDRHFVKLSQELSIRT